MRPVAGPAWPVPAGLLAGVALDAILGDPRRGHPVAAFGRLAMAVERSLYRDSRRQGALFVLSSTVPLLVVTQVAARALRHRPIAYFLATAVTCWAVVGARSLAEIASRLATALGNQDEAAARGLISQLCGRDPDSLDRDALVRATVESVAENTSDAVTGPLCWGAVAGLPGLVGYRLINTLDAMVGHRSSRYARFGTAAARLDDVANIVPARTTAILTLLLAPLVQGSPMQGWRIWRADGWRHPSPNAGPCEASMAGALGIWLGGATQYQGRVEQRPRLGNGLDAKATDIDRAVRLSRAVEITAAVLSAAVAVVVKPGSRPRRYRAGEVG